MDDPVNYVDPTGLIPAAAVAAAYFIGGTAGAFGLGYGASYGAAKLSDTIESERKGKEVTKARDGMKGVLKPTAATVALPTFPAAAYLFPSVSGHVSRTALTRLVTSNHGDKILKAGRMVRDFAEPFVVPGPAATSSGSTLGGTLINEGIKWYQQEKDKTYQNKNEK